ncbi:MAG: Uncharacterized MFS-type transporter, partial [uncultured Rubrobacteraceae bacterium]
GARGLRFLRALLGRVRRPADGPWPRPGPLARPARGGALCRGAGLDPRDGDPRLGGRQAGAESLLDPHRDRAGHRDLGPRALGGLRGAARDARRALLGLGPLRRRHKLGRRRPRAGDRTTVHVARPRRFLRRGHRRGHRRRRPGAGRHGLPDRLPPLARPARAADPRLREHPFPGGGTGRTRRGHQGPPIRALSAPAALAGRGDRDARSWLGGRDGALVRHLPARHPWPAGPPRRLRGRRLLRGYGRGQARDRGCGAPLRQPPHPARRGSVYRRRDGPRPCHARARARRRGVPDRGPGSLLRGAHCLLRRRGRGPRRDGGRRLRGHHLGLRRVPARPRPRRRARRMARPADGALDHRARRHRHSHPQREGVRRKQRSETHIL